MTGKMTNSKMGAARCSKTHPTSLADGGFTIKAMVVNLDGYRDLSMLQNIAGQLSCE